MRAVAGLLCILLLGHTAPLRAQATAPADSSASLFDQNDLIYAGAFTLPEALDVAGRR